MSRVVEHLAELTGFRDRDVLDVTLVGAFKELLRPQGVAIYRCVGEPGQQRWLTRARLQPGDSTATADPLWADPAMLPELRAHPLRLACLQGEQTLASTDDPGGATTTCFALASEQQVLGVLELQTAQPLSTADMRLVGSILRVYRNFQGLLDYSERDSLTGLLNRKTFDESFLRIASSSGPPTGAVGGDGGRRQGPGAHYWLGVIDIDHFKRVNDGFGHLIGDEVLLLLSRLMRTSFRFYDHLYRFGGEEFVALMRCNSATDAASAFERLRSNVQKYVFPQVGNITVSVGFTAVRPGDAPSAAFERADKAVYHAKQNGRNQVAEYADLVARGLLAEAARSSDVELF
jgi:diguanylate cyclase (GGDEF)-like protein